MNVFTTFAMNIGILVWVFTNSIDNLLRLLKGESNTIPAIELSLAECIIDVAAPIDLPHNPINDTLSVERR